MNNNSSIKLFLDYIASCFSIFCRTMNPEKISLRNTLFFPSIYICLYCDSMNISWSSNRYTCMILCFCFSFYTFLGFASIPKIYFFPCIYIVYIRLCKIEQVDRRVLHGNLCERHSSYMATDLYYVM